MNVLAQMTDDFETYRDNPVGFCEDWLGSHFWSKQREIVESVFLNTKTAVRSCHSSGKTFTAADVVLAFLILCAPAKVITTAPTWAQVNDLLWSEIRTKFKYKLADALPEINILKTRLELDDDWFALGLSPKEAINFQGFHQQNILIVFDEAPGVKPEIVDAADSLMASGNAHCLWIGNPTESTGHFFDAFRGSEFNKIHISYKDTPNFTGEDVPEQVKRALITPAWVEGRRQAWGGKSPLFMSRCDGDFPEGTDGSIISLALCEEAIHRDVTASGEKELGVDVAAGGDLTAYCVKHGNVLLGIQTESTRDTMTICGRVVRLNEEHHFKIIRVDMHGLGKPVIDRLKELGLPAVGISSAGHAVDQERYADRRTEMWFDMADWLKYGKIPEDYEFVNDLTAPLTDPPGGLTSRGQYKIEKKEKTRERLKRSPDRGDAGVYAVQSGIGTGNAWMW